MANTEVERHTGVDVEDVPSAEWGWSQENYKWIHIGGLLSAGALLVFVVARDWWLRRRGWIR